MKIDREKVKRIIEQQSTRDDSQRGMQPLMTLECFYNRNFDDDSSCKRCRNYFVCNRYFKWLEDRNR